MFLRQHSLYAFSTHHRRMLEVKRDGVPEDKNPDAVLKTFKQFVEENPCDGTTEQVVTLSLGIAEAGKRLDKSVFVLYKDEANIGSKVFSKLKIIIPITQIV